MKLQADDPFNQRDILCHVAKTLELKRDRWRRSKRNLDAALANHDARPTVATKSNLDYRRDEFRAWRIEHRKIFRRFLRIRAAVRAMDAAAQQKEAA